DAFLSLFHHTADIAAARCRDLDQRRLDCKTVARSPVGCPGTATMALDRRRGRGIRRCACLPSDEAALARALLCIRTRDREHRAPPGVSARSLDSAAVGLDREANHGTRRLGD